MAGKSSLIRHRPNLPSRAEDLRILCMDEVLDDEPIDESLISGIDFSGSRLRGLNVGASLLEGVSFAGCEIREPRLRDVRLVKCDLSNVIWRGFQATRVDFIDCRLTGMSAIECRWQDVRFENCDGRYAQLGSGRIQRSEIVGSSFAEADFRSTDLEGTIFERASLSRADLSYSKLKATDLRGAEIEGMTVRPEDVSGAIVNAAQAMELARLLGLHIR